MNPHAVSWFDIPVVDFERAKKFYSNILDYEMFEQMNGDIRMGFLPHNMKEGGVGGAIVKAENMIPNDSGTCVYLNGGEDLSVPLGKVEKEGGKVIVPKTQISPEIGFFAMFLDSEGNRVGFFSVN